MQNAKLGNAPSATQGVALGEANGSLDGTHCAKILHCVQNDNSNTVGTGVPDRPFSTPIGVSLNAKCDARVADLCTGSGCIGLSLLLHGATDRVMLMDISEGALSMARKNARLHGAEDRCDFVLGDICRDLPKRKYKMIVSNPPYIPTKDIEGLPEEVKKEPRLALDGGDDGLDLIRFLIGDGLSSLDENGVMLIEFGFDQGEIMDALLREKCDTGSIKSYEILRDYGNNPRVAVIYGN